jgi:UrcA family protein
MKHSTFRTDTLNEARAKLVLMTFCAAGLMAAIAQQQPVRADDVHTARVSTAGLDLTTDVGMAAASARVRDTARRLCTQVEDMDDLSHHENYLACVDAAVSAALHQLKPPALAATGKTAERETP